MWGVQVRRVLKEIPGADIQPEKLMRHVFKPVKRKARIGRNPNNPSVEVRIPEKWVADFKPGRIMKMRVSELEGRHAS